MCQVSCLPLRWGAGDTVQVQVTLEKPLSLSPAQGAWPGGGEARPVVMPRPQSLRPPGLQHTGHGAQASGSGGVTIRWGKCLPLSHTPSKPRKRTKIPRGPSPSLGTPITRPAGPPPLHHGTDTGRTGAPAHLVPQRRSLPSGEVAWRGWEVKPIVPNSLAEPLCRPGDPPQPGPAAGVL